MSIFKNKGLTIATIVYWFLLLYIVAALIWWFIALQQQNRQMTTYKLMELRADDPAYLAKAGSITKEEHRKSARNIGEGAIFFLLILVGAVFVYKAVHRQFKITEQQQNLMMAITHELKTPIAITKLNLETLLKHKLDEQTQQKLFQTTLQETERLNTLANNFLISSQLEGDGHQMAKEELSLSELAETVIQDYRNRYPAYTWIVDTESNLTVYGDRLLLQILVSNLLDNAIKYSPKQSRISFLLKKQRRFIYLHVIDEGPGIPEKEKKKIFDRFYRMGNESIRATKGTGLGLYLCRKIAADHNAVIEVTNNPGAGSNFAVRFKV